MDLLGSKWGEQPNTVAAQTPPFTSFIRKLFLQITAAKHFKSTFNATSLLRFFRLQPALSRFSAFDKHWVFVYFIKSVLSNSAIFLA